MDKDSQRRVWIVAAGTGGHIFPGLSIAKKLLQKDPSIRVLFWGSRDRLESKLIPKHGYEIQLLSAGRWKGHGILGRLSSLVALGIGFLQVMQRLLFVERPRFLLSVGGYVSFPLALACGLMRVPIFLLEPNICAGLANRVVSRWARFAFCSPASDAQELFKCPVEDLGSPVREDLKALELRPQVKEILVLGGSQGAMALNTAILKTYKNLNLASRGIQLTVQSGEAHLEKTRALKSELGLGESVAVKSFIDNIAEEFARKDLVIARSGAMTVAELATVGMPTIFVPYPFAADDHQRKNAELLEKDNAAWMIEQTNKDFESRLQERVEQIISSADSLELRKVRSQNFMRWSRPKAAEQIVERILSLS
jgi:UDP-N-acetylglucosamine--N-acetylmuramyl-(pentapeptide) pyrophosphoryl-undecaprenol N-acetylglucosamine transferase